MRISLEDGTIYYEKGVVIKHGMSSSEVLQQLGMFYPNPEKNCVFGEAWFPVLPNVRDGLKLKVDVMYSSQIKDVYLVVPRIKFPKPKEQQIEHLKKAIGEEIFNMLSDHDNTCNFSWGMMRLSWNGRDEEIRLHICYR